MYIILNKLRFKIFLTCNFHFSCFILTCFAHKAQRTSALSLVLNKLSTPSNEKLNKINNFTPFSPLEKFFSKFQAKNQTPIFPNILQFSKLLCLLIISFQIMKSTKIYNLYGIFWHKNWFFFRIFAICTNFRSDLAVCSLS